ncbi:MAG: hypothetical protein KKG47_00045 [Proteobacteria bacterium]|nr:hypothetical protein [Pseudomonadota bacterium]MBU1738485.1 hypothetical protein [Pseudomonadota bacterium]
MGRIWIDYKFSWQGGRAAFALELDDETISLCNKELAEPPFWTRLDFYQCPNCPLQTDRVTYCPAAIALIPVINCFEGVVSHDEMHLEVITEERRVLQKTSAQRAIGSMMGLVFATSGCPHTKYFRPMARHHLPLANSDETIMRAVSMYLLAQYFRANIGETPDLKLEGLGKIYKEIQVVNMAMAERLRAAVGADSSINAVILLDMYAKAMPYVIEDALEEIRYLFRAYLE